jgi:DNA-binding NtrC family response regulator
LEQANGSTVMFEEVGGLRPEHQGQILRFADEKLVQRIGDTTPRSVSARIVSTTSMDLRSRFDEDLFRKDLFFRLCGYEITLPPLRDRPDDIPELALHLARQANHGTGIRFTNAALRRLMQHGWPGNIRELKNVVLRACRKSNGRTIDLKSLDFLEQQAAMEVQQKPQIEPVSDTQTEREWIAQALARNGFRRAQTAKELGITTRTLFNKIKKHRLQS